MADQARREGEPNPTLESTRSTHVPQVTEYEGLAISPSLRSVVELRGNRVLLTPVLPEDTERVYDACQDAQFARWLPWARGDYTWEMATDFVSCVAPQSWENGIPIWAIRPLDKRGNPGELAGVIDVRPHGEGATKEVGFWMHRDAQHKGLMTEANRLVARAAFEEMGVTRLVHLAEVGNNSSRRIARNLGFIPEGIRRIPVANETSVETQWQSALLKSDWERIEGDTTSPEFPGVPPASVLPGDRPADLVSEFHAVYHMPNVVAQGGEASLVFDRLGMRMALIAEEVTELVEAVYGPQAAKQVEAVFVGLSDEGRRDVIEAADALADLVYVIYGMALEAGIDLDAVLAEVHSSNLSKLMPDGSVKRREDGKILKGPNFREPDIASVLLGNS